MVLDHVTQAAGSFVKRATARNAEILGHFTEQALATGALDVFHTPIQMKKNRPGVLLYPLWGGIGNWVMTKDVLRGKLPW